MAIVKFFDNGLEYGERSDHGTQIEGWQENLLQKGGALRTVQEICFKAGDEHKFGTLKTGCRAIRAIKAADTATGSIRH
jgi:hypothetical protein